MITRIYLFKKKIKLTSIKSTNIKESAYNCIRNGIKVYPVFNRGWCKIEVDINGKKKTGEKKISQHTNKASAKLIDEAMKETYKYFNNKLNEKKIKGR